MDFEYGFDDPIINVGIAFGIGIWFLLGVFFFSKITYQMYKSEYDKDPSFSSVPYALRWKQPILIFFSVFILGFPFLGLMLAACFSVFYLFSPILAPELFNLIQYFVVWGLYTIYMLSISKRLERYLYSFVKDNIKFERYFRTNSKNWGLANSGDDIIICESEYSRLALFGKIALHIGMVPILIISIIGLF